MTLISLLQFVTSIVGYLASSSLFGIVIMGVFCFFLIIALIRVVWYLVQFN